MCSMTFGWVKYIPAQATAQQMEFATMDFASVIRDFMVSTAPIQLVLDPCVAMMKTTFSTVLIVATIAQKVSKFHVNSMTMRTSSQVHLTAFVMGSELVSVPHPSSGRTAVF